MFYDWSRGALAILQDGSTLIGDLTPTEYKSPIVLDVGRIPLWSQVRDLSFSLLQVYSGWGSTVAGLTSNDRVIVGICSHEPFIDITEAVDVLLGPANSIEDIHTHSQLVVIKAGSRIAVFYVASAAQIRERRKDRASYDAGFGFTNTIVPMWVEAVTRGSIVRTAQLQFQCNIRLSYYNYYSGLAVTEDNRLYWFGDTNSRRRCASPPGLPYDWQIREIPFDRAEAISELYCGDAFLLMRMDDGQVYACQPRHSPDALEPPVLISFPDHESVSKIVTDGYHILYITTSGHCYYTHARYSFDTWKFKIRLLKSLEGLLVENVFIVGKSVIVKHDTGKLSIIYLFGGLNGSAYPHRPYQKGTRKPDRLPTFDDKNIVAVVSLFWCTYFITSEGHAYWTGGQHIRPDSIVARDPTFDSNPISIPNLTSRIRSARNDPNDKHI